MYKQEGLLRKEKCMPRNRFFHCLTLAAAVFLLWETQASAYETRIITDHANTPLFQLRFFDQGEEYGNALSETEGEVSTWQLSAAQKDAVTRPWNSGRTFSVPERTTPCPPPSTWAP